ncbi:hypothetical protein [Thiothrix nivea]|uniref:Uncharacterized protein n=1 Tax=Thiothrix nivea (strain ATCC 35100 / DSM 5205 / JP2) TaxID=870187 RepID=A0A656HNE4_THINJ|nr:hypothetical protein [Thiothrix nivea]EIJ37066.1 hypothetical protein Thini_0057 [Thiothrix nivea DSM 5205]
MNNMTIKQQASGEQAQTIALLQALLETQRKLAEANREHLALLQRVRGLERLLQEGEVA